MPLILFVFLADDSRKSPPNRLFPIQVNESWRFLSRDFLFHWPDIQAPLDLIRDLSRE